MKVWTKIYFALVQIYKTLNVEFSQFKQLTALQLFLVRLAIDVRKNGLNLFDHSSIMHIAAKISSLLLVTEIYACSS